MLARLKDLSAGCGEGKATVSLSESHVEFLQGFLDPKKDKAIIDKLNNRPCRVTGEELARLIQRAENPPKSETKAEA